MEDGYDVVGNHSGKQFKVADLIWVETDGGSWWPAQVVSENTVSGNNKPLKTSPGEVPVRIYGSYKFVYVDPQKYFSDFDMILKQNNGSHRDIFLQALEQKQSKQSEIWTRSSKYHPKSNERLQMLRSFPISQKNGKKVDDKANGKPIKPDGLLKNASIVQAELLTEAGARRLRVMRESLASFPLEDLLTGQS